MSCPHCHRERDPEPSSIPGAPVPEPVAIAGAPVPEHPPLLREALSADPIAPHHKRLRAARKTGWLLPGILLVLMPKCPVCLAAYIALFTGISIPVTTAAWLRESLIIGCVGALVWLATRGSLYLYRRYIQ